MSDSLSRRGFLHDISKVFDVFPRLESLGKRLFVVNKSDAAPADALRRLQDDGECEIPGDIGGSDFLRQHDALRRNVLMSFQRLDETVFRIHLFN